MGAPHTPGPWTDRQDDRGDARVISADVCGRTSAVAYVCTTDDGYVDGSDTAGNARLVAAAPELLAYALAEEEARHRGRAHLSAEELDGLDALRRAALAKAGAA